MRPRNVLLTLLLLVSLFLFAIFRKRQEPLPQEVFHRAPARLYYYAFARCRMQCMSITENDIQTLMKTGVVNLNRSNRALRPCPTFALQARIRDRYLRVVFEQCRNGTFVMNCYNLEQDTACDCSADYKPKKD